MSTLNDSEMLVAGIQHAILNLQLSYNQEHTVCKNTSGCWEAPMFGMYANHCVRADVMYEQLFEAYEQLFAVTFFRNSSSF